MSAMAALVGMTVLLGWVDWSALGRWARPHVVPLALFAAAAGGLVVAVGRLRGRRAPRVRAAGLSWWIVAADGVAVAVVGWGATNWLLSEASTAKDPGAARVEAIKTAAGTC
jgi:hypothetical protein